MACIVGRVIFGSSLPSAAPSDRRPPYASIIRETLSLLARLFFGAHILHIAIITISTQNAGTSSIRVSQTQLALASSAAIDITNRILLTRRHSVSGAFFPCFSLYRPSPSHQSHLCLDALYLDRRPLIIWPRMRRR